MKQIATLLIGGLGGALPLSASAHFQPTDPISYCREQSSGKSERIECLENAITQLIAGEKATRQAAGKDAGSGDASQARSASSEATAGAKETLTTAEAEAAPSGLGAEQVIARQERETKEGREERRERIRQSAAESRIVDFAHTATGRLIIVLENGQVWAQRSSDSAKVRLREGERPDVKVRRGALSGYRMEISDPNITITVERLR